MTGIRLLDRASPQGEETSEAADPQGIDGSDDGSCGYNVEDAV